MIRFFAFLFLCYGLASFAFANDNVIPYFDGIPVMPNFEIIDDGLILFDKPEGQIAEAALICRNQCPNETDIKNYYATALPQLGWTSLNETKTRFIKQDKKLNFSISNTSDSDAFVILAFQSES